MITDLDVIVEEWAYRVHDGKPNPKNDNHIYVLSNLLYEVDLSIKQYFISL